MNKLDAVRAAEPWKDIPPPRTDENKLGVHTMLEKIVTVIAPAVAPEYFVSLDEVKDRTDSLIVLHAETTTVVPLRFTKNLAFIDGTPILATQPGGAKALAVAIIDELARIAWRGVG